MTDVLYHIGMEAQGISALDLFEVMGWVAYLQA
jgi:hypothetical protein